MFFFLLLGFFLFAFLFFFCSSTKNPNPISTPPSYPFIGSLISFYANRRRLLDWYTELLSLSPSQTITLCRLGARPTVVTANPSNVEHILKSNFPNFPKGKPFTDILGDLLGSGIFNVDGELWCSQRKLASHEFTARTLRDLVLNVLREEVDRRLVPLLEEAVERENVVDMQEILKRFAFDVVCKVSLGFDPNCLDLTRPIPPLVQAFETAAEICARRATEPIYAVWKVKRALNIGSERRLKEAISVVQQSVSEIIRIKKRKLENGEKNEDMLSRFLSTGNDEETVRDMLISFIMAGRDTTSAAMTWLFWLVSQNRHVESEIVQEVNFLLDKKPKGSLDFDDLKEMNYTKACLCESMRLYPPVAWDSKFAAADDVLPDGTPVRKGDKVTYFPYGMGRMEELWGKDRLEFKPDRWSEAELDGSNRIDKVLKPVSPYKFPVFQAGPRVCLGKEMAFVQMKYVVGSVLNRFQIEPVGMDRPVFVPLLTAHMAGGLKVKIKRREGK